ncbi:MAG: hypothetical protein JSS02_27730, partial [Planctomycetes bacterium]|nr:hypothetical protein [Planctomycetota bacterium]
MLLRPWLADLLGRMAFTTRFRRKRRTSTRLRRRGHSKSGFGAFSLQAEVLENRTLLSSAVVIADLSGNGNANDISGHGHDGTLVNGAGFGVGKFGQQAFHLNGVNQYVSVPDSSDWDLGGGPFSISVWANFDSISTRPFSACGNTLIGQDEGGGNLNKWFFSYLSDGSLGFHINSPDGGPVFLTSPDKLAVAPGSWNLLSVVYANNTFTFYENATLLGAVSTAAVIPAVNAPLTIGEVEGAGYFSGRLQSVEIYNGALSASDISQLAVSSVTWTGAAGDGKWTTAGNWSSNTLPGPDDDVIINAPNNETIQLSSASVTIKSLQALTNLEITGSSLRVTSGVSQISGTLTLSTSLLTVDGAGTSLIATGATTADGSSLAARNGGTLSLPELHSFKAYSGGIAEYSSLSAVGTGSVLDLSNVTELSGTVGWADGFGIIADQGGRLDLSGVIEITTGSAQVKADGTDSVVDFSSLTRFTATYGFQTPGATLMSANGGRLLTPNLATLGGISVSIDADTLIDLENLVSFTTSALTVDGTNVVLQNVTNVDGSSLVVRGGGALALPAVRHFAAYSGGIGESSSLSAVGAGSVLDLSNVSGLSGTTGWADSFGIIAEQGGRLDLSGVVAITTGSAQVKADGTDSVVDFSSLTQFSATYGFQTPVATLMSSNGGSLLTSNLESLDSVSLSIAADTLIDLGKLVSVTSSELIVDGTNFELQNVTRIDGSSITVRSSGRLTIPSVSSYDAGLSQDRYLLAESGGVLDLSHITSLTASATGDLTYIQAYSGGQVLLPGLASIDHNSVGVYAQDDGSRIDLSRLTTWTGSSPVSGRSSSLEAGAGSQVDVSRLTSLDAVNILLGHDSTLSTAQFQSYTFGQLIVESPNADLSGLQTITGSNVLARGAGVVVSFPQITQYDAGIYYDKYLEAVDGAVLDLTNVVTLVTSATGHSTYILAYNGGHVLLPGLASIDHNSVSVYAQDDGSQIDLSHLTAWTGSSRVSGRTSSLEAGAGSQVDVSRLTSLDAVNILLGHDSTLSTAQFHSYTFGQLIVESPNTDLSGLQTITGSNVLVRGAGVVVSFPGITQYDAGIYYDKYLEAVDGAVLDLSHITSLIPSATGHSTYIRAYSGGHVLLPGLTSIDHNSV